MAQTKLWAVLMMRTMFFLVFGLLMIGLFAGLGFEEVMKEAEKWWPYQAILANIASFLVLKSLLKKEGKSYNSVLQFKKGKTRKDLLRGLFYLIIAFVVGAIGLYGFSYIFLGSSQPPTNMMQAIPVVAAIIAVILFPLTNALVELPTYFGYAFPKIEKKWGLAWAFILPALFLAIQHAPLPIVLGGSYLAWRVFAFVPLAFVVAFLYHKSRNITPLLFAHYVMDLQMVVYVLLASLGVPIV